jgi:predicted dehydrogenase
MSAVRVGVIGYGYWGPNLARNFYELSGSELVTIVDRKDDQLERARSKYPEVVLTKDYKELFDMDLEAVVISSPPKTHFEIARECLSNGLHVFVEKPMVLNSQHAEELIELANSKSLILMVGHIFEYNSAVLEMKKYIDSKELGDVYYIDTARLNLGLFQNDSNVLWDLAPHDISTLLYLLGQTPVSVSAHGMACVTEGVHDLAYLNLVFPNNLMAFIHVSWLDPSKVRRITVVGSKKMAVYNDLGAEGKIKIYDKGVDPEYTDTFGEFQYAYRTGDITIPSFRFVEPLREECQHFLDCVVSQSEPRSSGLDGLRVIKILEAAERSMKNGSTREVIKW